MNIAQALADLRRLSGSKLRKRFAELFGYTTRNRCRVWFIRRIAWRLQANAFGELSERGRARAAELVKEARLGGRSKMPLPTNDGQGTVLPATDSPDRRLPPAGTIIVRYYKERRVQSLPCA